MMFDDLHNPDHRRSSESERRRGARFDDQSRVLSDREVPLGQRDGMAPALHGWLDGELPEAAVRKGDLARHAEMWRRINREASQLRHLRTPNGVEDRIMAAVPQTVPQAITPWYQREFVVTPAVAVSAGTVLVAVGASLATLVVTLVR